MLLLALGFTSGQSNLKYVKGRSGWYLITMGCLQSILQGESLSAGYSVRAFGEERERDIQANLLYEGIRRKNSISG